MTADVKALNSMTLARPVIQTFTWSLKKCWLNNFFFLNLIVVHTSQGHKFQLKSTFFLQGITVGYSYSSITYSLPGPTFIIHCSFMGKFKEQEL